MFDKICDKFLYLISGKSGNADGINPNFGEMRTDSYNYLHPLKKYWFFIMW